MDMVGVGAGPRPTGQRQAQIDVRGDGAVLRDAKIGAQRNIPRGVTLPKRATLTSDDGKIVHDASIQTVHESKTSYTTSRGTELNFKDWWEFNVAAYELPCLGGSTAP